MAENIFTQNFKKNLRNHLECYFDEERVNLDVKTEYVIRIGDVENRIDIGIYDSENENHLIGIKIENIYNRQQIFKNYNNFKNWVHVSKKRKGGLLHIISYESDLDYEDSYKLFLKSYHDTSKGLDFFYEFFALKNIDH